jgi:hypothetical protein
VINITGEHHVLARLLAAPASADAKLRGADGKTFRIAPPVQNAGETLRSVITSASSNLRCALSQQFRIAGATPTVRRANRRAASSFSAM